MYRTKPPRPKYSTTWDTNLVLKYLAELFPYDNLPLKDFSLKAVTLLAIASAQRMQTLSLIKVKNISITADAMTIKIDDLIKTSKPGSCQPLIKLPFIKENPKICPALAVKKYIEKTQFLRTSNNDNYLFLSYKKPHQKVTSQTLGHWVKNILQLSGIDISVFGAHSTRHASTSAAHLAGINLEVVRKAAGWSDKSNVFLKYYNRDVVQTTDDFVMAIFDKNP